VTLRKKKKQEILNNRRWKIGTKNKGNSQESYIDQQPFIPHASLDDLSLSTVSSKLPLQVLKFTDF